MSCKHGYYKDNEYFPKLYCRLNDKYCIYSKKCDRVGKFIQIEESWKECFLLNMEKKSSIPKNSYYIEFEKNGYLYIDIDKDTIVKVKNTIGEINQDYIYLKEGIDGYEISLFPFQEIKRTYTRKKINEEKTN